MPICCSCEKESGRVKSSQYCAPCYRERERIAGRARQARFTSERRRAHVLVGCALAKGDLVPQPCETCGSLRYVEAHHDDYAQPLAVRWLCKRHHRQHHVKFGPGLNAFRKEISA